MKIAKAEPPAPQTQRMVAPAADPELAALLEKAKDHVMTDEEKQAQRESWVRGEMGLDRAPAPAEGAGLPAEAPGGGMIAPVGPHKRVFEYDGSYKCLDCKGKWGAFDGRPSMPLACGVAAHAGEEDRRQIVEHCLTCPAADALNAIAIIVGIALGPKLAQQKNPNVAEWREIGKKVWNIAQTGRNARHVPATRGIFRAD